MGDSECAEVRLCQSLDTARSTHASSDGQMTKIKWILRR